MQNGGKRLFVAAIATGAALASLSSDGFAQPAPWTTNVPIVGGTVGVARAIGIDPAPDPPRFIAELTRLIYDAPEGKSVATMEKIRRLDAHLELVQKFREALAAAQPAGGAVRLDMARQKNDRNRLQTFLALVGLKLKEQKSTFRVERTDNKDAAERVRLLGEIGIDLGQLAARLNAGEAVHVAVPVEEVPVALNAKTWGDVIFERRVAGDDLFAAIIGDRNAALLARGLAGMDDPTLAFLSDHPKLLRRLYGHGAPAMAAFGDSLHVRNGRLVPPGGDPAIELWRAVVDERPEQPEAFIGELFGKANGRIAYLFDVVAHLTPEQRGFVLGLNATNAANRVERFKALADVASSAYESWNLSERPFKRLPRDLAVLLSRLDVDQKGSLRGPAARIFWKRVFESAELPDDAAKLLRKGQDDADIDAAWLAEQLVVSTVAERTRRFEQFMFGQRVFAGIDDADLPHALVALRAYPRFPMLLLTLDRAGVRTPSLLAAAARHAERLGALDPSHAFVALSQFQGAVAIVERLATVGSLSPAKSEDVVTALVQARLTGDGGYGGTVAEWMTTSLAPAIGAATGLTEVGLLAALAGAPGLATTQPVTWEGQSYRLDLAAPELRRLSRLRARLASVALDTVMELEATRRLLLSADVSVPSVQAEAARLQKISAALSPPARSPAPPGVELAKPPRETLAKIGRELAKIKKPQDAKKAQKSAEPLGEVVDVLLAQSLRSLVYAMSAGAGDGTLLTADVGERHDFGFATVQADAKRMPWMIPEPQIEAGTPWHVRGSLLGLDVGLGAMSLTRIAADAPGRPPVLTEAARQRFITSYVLMNAGSLRDQDRDAIAEAIDRGRARIAAAALGDAVSGLDDIADVLDFDGWRQRTVRWMWDQHKDASSFFALSELLALGRPPEDARLDGWGVAAIELDGCLCTRSAPRPQWDIAAGRREVAPEPAQVADLQLRVAVALHELRLPARLARGVLSAALSDYLDDVHPADDDDWLTLVRTAQSIKLDRIQDYVAALTAAGPLVPDGGQDPNR